MPPGKQLKAALLAAIAGLVLLAGCASFRPETAGAGYRTPSTSAPEKEVVVFAASSLQEAFGALASDLSRVEGPRAVENVTFNFAGSQALATQLGQGARADVFASADEQTMNTAISSGVVEAGSQKPLATNRLVVIVSGDAASRISRLDDLVKPGLKIVLAGEAVPAGSYSLQMLRKMSADKAYGADYQKRVLANVVSRETNVRQVLAKVKLGEADAGIVYMTDARSAVDASPGAGGSEPGTVKVLQVPDEYNVTATYYIAPLKNAEHPEAARRFIAYALSAEGQKIVGSFGFGPAAALGR